jgi:hypothetical protein
MGRLRDQMAQMAKFERDLSARVADLGKRLDAIVLARATADEKHAASRANVLAWIKAQPGDKSQYARLAKANSISMDELQ